MRLLTLVRTVILARLLAPDDFGLMGIAMLSIELVTTFTSTGFTAALIQRKGTPDSRDLNTAWSFELARNVLLGALLALAAPAISDFFGSPASVQLIQLMAFGLAISGLRNVGVIMFDKELEFQRRFVYRAIPRVTELAVSVVAAFATRSAIALAIGWTAGRVAEVIASYVSHPYRPGLRWDRRRVARLYRFGVWILGSQILIYFTLNLDDIVVGRLVGAAALGLYQVAFTLSQLTTTEITQVVNQVAFPAYAKLQDSPQRLRRAYLSSLRFVALLAFPVALGLWFLSEEVIRVFLGTQWLPMLPAFEVLLLWGLIRSLLATTGPLFNGIGKPRMATRIQFAQLLILAAIIIPLTSRWDIVGAAWATVLAAIIPGTWAAWAAGREAHARGHELLEAVAFPGMAAAIMLAALTAVEYLTARLADAAMLIWAPAIGVLVYFLVIEGFRRLFGFAPDGLLGGVSRSSNPTA